MTSEIVQDIPPALQPLVPGEGGLSPEVKEPLEGEIARLGSNRFEWLGHPRALEDYFEASTCLLRSRRMWIEGLCCVVIFNCFLISDYIFFPHAFLHFLVVRLGCATPPAIVALVLLRRGVSKTVREGMVVLVCFLFAASILYLYSDVSAVVSSYAVTDMAILVLFTNVGLRPRLPYAIFAGVMCLGMGGMFMGLDRILSMPEKLESVAILLAAVFLSLVGNYSIERADRLNFLLRLRSDAEFGVLAQTNDELLVLTREDRLTGVANRGYFDEIYEAMWAEGIARPFTLSVIMIDIDNFKALNDRYGHPYGDAVLKRVAILLQQCMRKEGDFVARYGGEEFVVVLPESSETAALRVAQRIRLLIEVAGSPAIAEQVADEHGWATVSCGVATTLPRAGTERDALVALADTALYRAKAEGRNRVCVASDMGLGR